MIFPFWIVLLSFFDSHPNTFEVAPYLVIVIVGEYKFFKGFGRFIDSPLRNIR